MEVLVLVPVLAVLVCPVPSSLGWLTCVGGAGPGGKQDMWGTTMRALRGSTKHSRDKGALALSTGSVKLQQCRGQWPGDRDRDQVGSGGV